MEPLDSLDNSLLSTFTGEVSQCVRAAITVSDGIATNLHCKRLTPPIRASVEHGLSWAVAGRSEGKLQAVLDRAGKAVAADLSSTPVIVSARLTLYPFLIYNQIADSSDTSSLLGMAAQAKVVLNCVGPYR